MGCFVPGGQERPPQRPRGGEQPAGDPLPRCPGWLAAAAPLPPGGSDPTSPGAGFLTRKRRSR